MQKNVHALTEHFPESILQEVENLQFNYFRNC